MVSNGKELLGERYDRDHLTYEEIEALDFTVVTEKGETVSSEELRGKIFRIVDRDEPSGYVVKNMETTGKGTTLCYLQATSS
jgi:ribosomal protein S24E